MNDSAAEGHEVVQRARSTDVRAFLSILHQPGDVFEVRAPNTPTSPGGTFTTTHSGYFDDAALAAMAIAELDRLHPPGIYVTLNPCNPDLLGRAHNKIKARVKATTADDQILRRQWLFLDVDPTRATETSSTDAEMQLALDRAAEINQHLTQRGWPAPLRGMSGNGAYRLYRIDLPPDDGGLVKSFLDALAREFSDAAVRVDTGTANASRIVKALGTWARKGDDFRGTDNASPRPHRQSWFEPPTGRLQIVTEHQMRQLVSEAGDEPPVAIPSHAHDVIDSSEFDQFDHTPDGVEDYLRQHDIEVRCRQRREGCTLLFLNRCPVQPQIEDQDGTSIAVRVDDDGTISYCNFHERAGGMGGTTWIDLRDALEPGYRLWAEDCRHERQRQTRQRTAASARVPDGGQGQGSGAENKSSRRPSRRAAASSDPDARDQPEQPRDRYAVPRRQYKPVPGPSGLALRLTGPPRRTPTRITAPFEVLLKDKCVAHLQISNTVSCIANTARIIRDHLPGDRIGISEVRRFVARALADAHGVEHDASSCDTKALDIVMAAAHHRFDLRYRDGSGQAWSEADGRWIRRPEFTAYTPRSLLDELRSHVPELNLPDARLAPVVARLLGVAWATIGEELPPEEDVQGLDPQTKAAAEFRRAMIRLWTGLTTFEVAKTTDPATAAKSVTAARASLMSRARRRFEEGEVGGPWTPVQSAFDGWWRSEPTGEMGPGGQPKGVLWLGMRYTLMHQMRVKLPGVTDQRSLNTLAERYGISAAKTPGCPPTRFSGGHRLLVLSREFTDNELLTRPVEDAGEEASP